METIRFARKPFEVDAVRVTEENMADVAKWCGGEIQTHIVKKTNEPEAFVKVNVERALNEKQTRAFIGDWVLKGSTGFKVYTNRAMENSFQKVLIYSYEDSLAQLGETPQSTNLFDQPAVVLPLEETDSSEPGKTVAVSDDGHEVPLPEQAFPNSAIDALLQDVADGKA